MNNIKELIMFKLSSIPIILSALFLPFVVNAENSKSLNNDGKDVTLHFNPSSSKPQCHDDSRHYLIVNNAGYYNSVFETCTKNKKFLHFWGWDNGEYTIFKPEMYSYWTLLPEKI